MRPTQSPRLSQFNLIQTLPPIQLVTDPVHRNIQRLPSFEPELRRQHHQHSPHAEIENMSVNQTRFSRRRPSHARSISKTSRKTTAPAGGKRVTPGENVFGCWTSV